jgi:thiamine biosynthesis lipoprotein
MLLRVTIAACCACLLALPGCRKPAPPGSSPDEGAEIKEARESIMGTRVSVKIWVPAGGEWEQRARDAIEVAFSRALEVQSRMSPVDPASAVSRINASAGEREVIVDPWTFGVLARSVEVSRLTRGAFDPTWAALEDLWDYKASSPSPPLKEEVEARLGLVGVRGLELDSGRRSVKLLSAGMRIGLGGSAKGFALDKMADALRKKGFENFICSAGGDLYVSGRRGVRPWILGIQHPRARGVNIARFEVERPMAVVTSGDYERFFMHRGRRYHHILDPRTGFPASGTMSATLMASDGLTADALATGVFVLGADDGLSLVEGIEGVEAVIVDEAGGVHCSGSFCSRLEMLSDDFKIMGGE